MANRALSGAHVGCMGTKNRIALYRFLGASVKTSLQNCLREMEHSQRSLRPRSVPVLFIRDTVVEGCGNVVSGIIIIIMNLCHSVSFHPAQAHIVDGEVVKGKLIHRPCPTKIKIYSPLDRSDRRAIVVLVGAHNHPRFPATKLSREGIDKYTEAVQAHGVSQATVLKCDTGMQACQCTPQLNNQLETPPVSATSTKKIFSGKDLASVDPALALDRNRRKIVRSLKQKENPHGNGLEGSRSFVEYSSSFCQLFFG